MRIYQVMEEDDYVGCENVVGTFLNRENAEAELERLENEWGKINAQGLICDECKRNEEILNKSCFEAVGDEPRFKYMCNKREHASDFFYWWIEEFDVCDAE